MERRLDDVPTSVVAVETVERPQLVSLKSSEIGFLLAGLSICPELSATLMMHGAVEGGGVVVAPPPPPPPPLATAAAGMASEVRAAASASPLSELDIAGLSPP